MRGSGPANQKSPADLYPPNQAMHRKLEETLQEQKLNIPSTAAQYGWLTMARWTYQIQSGIRADTLFFAALPLPLPRNEDDVGWSAGSYLAIDDHRRGRIG